MNEPETTSEHAKKARDLIREYFDKPLYAPENFPDAVLSHIQTAIDAALRTELVAANATIADFAAAREELIAVKAERDEAKTLLTNWTLEFATKGTLANIYIAERDTASQQLAACREALKNIVEREEELSSSGMPLGCGCIAAESLWTKARQWVAATAKRMLTRRRQSFQTQPTNMNLTLNEIGERLRTQDNRCTADPMFCVQEKNRDVGYDAAYADRRCWHDSANEETIFDDDPDFKEPEGEQWDVFGYVDRWDTVMVAFTEEGCKEYLRLNGHNHRGETRIYAMSFRRCPEMLAIRAAILAGRAAADGSAAAQDR